MLRKQEQNKSDFRNGGKRQLRLGAWVLWDQGRRNKESTKGSLDRVSIYESIRYLRA